MNVVLNLIINGIPSILFIAFLLWITDFCVLNLIINGIPSIRDKDFLLRVLWHECFKPYYKWNTFNTRFKAEYEEGYAEVLNLIINGIPSIQKPLSQKEVEDLLF